MSKQGRLLWLLLSFIGIFVAVLFIYTFIGVFKQYLDEEGASITLRWTYIFWFTVGSISVLFLIILARIIAKVFHGRYKNTRVFISYFHEHSDIVSQIHTALEKEGAYVAIVPFLKYNYDTLIDVVRRDIIKCDCVIVIHGENRSFVDAEILAASVLSKPIILIDVGHNKTPDTALSGYPVFSWEKISKLECKALAYLIRLITPNCKDEFVRNIRIAKKSLSLYIPLALTTIVLSYIIEIIALPFGIKNTILVEDYSQEMFWMVYCIMVFRILILSLFQIRLANKIVRQLKSYRDKNPRTTHINVQSCI